MYSIPQHTYKYKTLMTTLNKVIEKHPNFSFQCTFNPYKSLQSDPKEFFRSLVLHTFYSKKHIPAEHFGFLISQIQNDFDNTYSFLNTFFAELSFLVPSHRYEQLFHYRVTFFEDLLDIHLQKPEDRATSKLALINNLNIVVKRPATFYNITRKYIQEL